MASFTRHNIKGGVVTNFASTVSFSLPASVHQPCERSHWSEYFTSSVRIAHHIGIIPRQIQGGKCITDSNYLYKN